MSIAPIATELLLHAERNARISLIGAIAIDAPLSRVLNLQQFRTSQDPCWPKARRSM